MNAQKTIFLVEDSDRDAELFTMALEQAQISVNIARARDGAEAWNMLHAQGLQKIKPSVIVLDIKLPRINGKELLEKIKQDPFLKSIPVVILTSSQNIKDIEDCYKLGANAYVVKPINFDQFFETIGMLGKFWCGTNKTVNDI